MIQYSIVLFCVLCFRPWSDAVQYCVVCCVSGHGVIQYSIVLCAVFQAME